MKFHLTTQSIATATILTMFGAFIVGPSSARAVSFNMPDQSSCDNGSTTLTWEGEGVARPQIESMTVDGVAVADPANPELNSLGAVICPSTTKGNRTSLSVIWHTSQGNTNELTDALTPNGDPVTESTQFAFTLTNLGDRAADLTFVLVYGSISSWTTSNLGTSSAGLSFTMSPVRTPQGSGDDFNLCTAVPPQCNATKSDSDVLGASMAMSFEPGVGSNMRGSYFAMTGAMGGWVSSATNSDGTKRLVASLGAPHFLADGTTLNTGNMTAFLPQPVLNSLFGLTSGDVDTSTLDVTRTVDSTTTSDVPFTLQAVTGGATLTVPTITFSSPQYTIKMTKAGIAKQKKIAVTPSKSKSTIKIVGKNAKANGTSAYRLEITTRNKLGKVIKALPALTTKNNLVIIGQPVWKSNRWLVTVKSTGKGTKAIKITSKGIGLATVSLKFR